MSMNNFQFENPKQASFSNQMTLGEQTIGKATFKILTTSKRVQKATMFKAKTDLLLIKTITKDIMLYDN